MVNPQKTRYLSSIAEELRSQATRVRDLIGPVHWLSDGHHKEYLLRAILTRYLPTGMLAARGFVIDPDDENACSREQDILIVDSTQEPPVFNQGGLLIAFPRTVLAAISVKTTMQKKDVMDSIRGLNSVRQIGVLAGVNTSIWSGSYHFELGDAVSNDHTLPYEYCREGVATYPLRRSFLQPEHSMPVGPDLICSANDLAFKLSYECMDAATQITGVRIRGYSCGGLATALFLADLLDHLAVRRGLPDADFARFAEQAAMPPLSIPEVSTQVSFAT